VTAAFFDACLRRCLSPKSPCMFGRNPREVLVLVFAELLRSGAVPT
jgi:hypothetical protein